MIPRYSEVVEVPVRPWILVVVALFLVAPPHLAHAQNSAFCQGFSEGWKTVKGEIRIVPIYPIAPITPIGSTPFREGIKAGMRRAGGRAAGGGNTGGVRTDR